MGLFVGHSPTTRVLQFWTKWLWSNFMKTRMSYSTVQANWPSVLVSVSLTEISLSSAFMLLNWWHYTTNAWPRACLMAILETYHISKFLNLDTTVPELFHEHCVWPTCICTVWKPQISYVNSNDLSKHDLKEMSNSFETTSFQQYFKCTLLFLFTVWVGQCRGWPSWVKSYYMLSQNSSVFTKYSK